MMKKKLARWKGTVFYILFAGLLMFSVDAWRTKDMPTYDVPPLAGVTLNGERVDVIEMSKGEPVIVYFWATWCAACKFVTPTVNWFDGKYQVVGVSLNSGADERVRRYMKAKAYEFHNINDLKGNISRQWGIAVTPTIAIIKDGEIKSVTSGITTPWGLIARLWMTNF